MPGVKMSAPINQSASSAAWLSDHCFTSEPNTSDMDSFKAPGWLWYSSPAVNSVTPWASSWAITSSDLVKSVKTTPSPSPNTISRPSQNALLYWTPRCTYASRRMPLSSIELRSKTSW